MRIKEDPRFTVTREFTGMPSPSYVLRYEGRWVFAYKTRSEAIKQAHRSIKQHKQLLKELFNRS